MVNLLPTPTASNPNDGESLESWEARRQRNKAKGINGNGQGTPLAIAVRLLPTPVVADARDTANFRPDGTAYNSGYGMTLTDTTRLLPTPRASDGEKGGPNRRGSKGDLMLPSAAARLLPTPTARDWKSGASNLHGVNSRPLGEVAILFPTPTPTRSDGTGDSGTSLNRVGGMNLRTAVASVAQDWGEFTPAVQRHEQLVGRPAPLPTEVGPRGGRRLSAPFAEWLMGLPDGWVTGVPGLTRSQQLQAIGNGVVPQQAEAAFKHLMTNWTELKGPDHE